MTVIADGGSGPPGGALTGVVSTGLAFGVTKMASAEEVGCRVRAAATGADGSSGGDFAEIAEVAEPGAMLLAATADLAALVTWSATICMNTGLERRAAVASCVAWSVMASCVSGVTLALAGELSWAETGPGTAGSGK